MCNEPIPLIYMYIKLVTVKSVFSKFNIIDLIWLILIALAEYKLAKMMPNEIKSLGTWSPAEFQYAIVSIHTLSPPMCSK